MWDEFHWVRIKPRSRDRWGHYDLIQPQPYLLLLLARLYCVSSSSSIYVWMQIYLVLKFLRVLTQYGQIRSPGPTLWRCFRCLLPGAESASIQNDLYVFQDVSLGFFNFSLLKVTLWHLKNLFKVFTKRAFKQASPCLHPNIEMLVHKTFTNGVSEHCIIHDSMRWENCSTLVCVCGCGVSSVWAAGINLLWQEYWEAWRLCTDNLH